MERSSRSHVFDELRRSNRAGRGAQPLRDRAHARAQRIVREQPFDRAAQLVRFVTVRVEPHAEAELVHALRVVVLIPEERQDESSASRSGRTP